MLSGATGSGTCLSQPRALSSPVCSNRKRFSGPLSSARSISLSAQHGHCNIYRSGHHLQSLCIKLRPVLNPTRSAPGRLYCASSSAAGISASSNSPAEDHAGVVPADTAQNTRQPQQQSHPGFLHQQLARIHLESALRRDDFRQSIAALARQLQGQARTSTPRNVLLTWLALPFLLIGMALRTPLQLLAGFHRERLVRLRLLRWVAKRSAVLKLNKATQADPANAEK